MAEPNLAGAVDRLYVTAELSRALFTIKKVCARDTTSAIALWHDVLL